MHPDVVLVDLFGRDLPVDGLGVDVDAQGLADLLDGDISVIVRAHVHPAVPLVDRATPRTHPNLNLLGGVDEVERLEVTGVTEDPL